MPTIEIRTQICGPIERCFDLARSMDFHKDCMSSHREEVVAGLATGLIGPDEQVTFRARHFGTWQTHSARISRFDRPSHFRDTMTRGAFRSFHHDHYFKTENGQTIMDDVVEFASPLGILGHLANSLFLTRYLTALLSDRAQAIKSAAESQSWKKYL